MTGFEVTTLPALIKYIEMQYSCCSLRLRMIEETAGGVSVHILVDNLGDAKPSDISSDLEKYKSRIREEVKLNTEIEVMVLERELELLKDIIEKSMRSYNIHGNVFGPVGDGASMGAMSICNNDLNVFFKLITEINAMRPEIAKVLPNEKMVEFDEVLKLIHEEVSTPQKDPSKIRNAWAKTKSFITEAVSFGANCSSILTSMNGINLPIG